MPGGNVSAFLAAPSREDCLHAVSLAFGKVRASGITYIKIAEALAVSADTIENAATGRGSLISFDTLAKAWHFWPEHFAGLAGLWGSAPDVPTTHDRIKRIEAELAAIKRETA